MSDLEESPTGYSHEQRTRTVFISYSRSDSSFVEDLSRWLQEEGYLVWRDLSQLRGGGTWPSEIDQAVRESDIVIVVLSPDSAVSEWVRKETLLALRLHKHVIPVLFRETEIPIQLVDVQFVDFRGNKEVAARALLQAITASPALPKISFQPTQYRKILTLTILGVLFTILFGVSTYLYLASKTKKVANENSNGVPTTSDTNARESPTPNVNLTRQRDANVAQVTGGDSGWIYIGTFVNEKWVADPKAGLGMKASITGPPGPVQPGQFYQVVAKVHLRESFPVGPTFELPKSLGYVPVGWTVSIDKIETVKEKNWVWAHVNVSPE